MAIDNAKASIRAKFERPLQGIEKLFGYRKVHDKDPAKNQARLFGVFGLAKLTRCKELNDRVSTP